MRNRKGITDMNTRILFTDLDGTLLCDDNTISQGNRAAIDEALAAGHKIVAATGRPLPSARIQTERLGLNQKGCYAITYNGGLIYDLYRQETLFEKPVSRSTALALLEAASARNLHIQTYSDTHVLSCRETPELIKYSAHALLPYQILIDPSAELKAEPHKLLAIDYNDHEKLLAYQRDVIENYSGELTSFFSNDYFLEIVPHGIDKGFAVKWLCNFLGIPIEHSVAAGDAQNDIAMLEAAHIGAVMCNAFPGIKEHGNYVTKADNNHDGVAEIIRKFILL